MIPTLVITDVDIYRA